MTERLIKKTPTVVTANGEKIPYVRIEQVTKRFDKFVAVDSVDLVINKGEIFRLSGSSGCGKSTLLSFRRFFRTH